MSPESFAVGMALLRDTWNRELSEPVVDLYVEACGHLSDTVWESACRSAIRSERFFPVPAVLLDHAAATVATAWDILAPGEAWRQVLGVASTWHERARVRDRFTPLVLDALDRIGGIRAVALADDGAELGRLERNFREAYAPRQKHSTHRALSQPLPTPDPARLTMPGPTVETDTGSVDRGSLILESTA